MLIGIDGLNLELLNPLVLHESLRNFQRIMTQGSYGTFDAILPIQSATSWTSMMTGKNPGKHGIWDFFDSHNYQCNRRIIDKSNVKSRTIWQYLDLFNLKSVIVNLPVTFPPAPLNGVMVSGMLTPPQQICTYPCHLHKKLKAAGYKIDLFNEQFETPLTYYEQAVQIMTIRQQVFRGILQDIDWDFATIDFSSISRFLHKFWNEKALIDNLFLKLDELLGSIIDEFDDGLTTFIVVSDHGYKSVEKKFFVNEWLWEAGYLSRHISTKEATIPDFWSRQFEHNGSGKTLARILAETKITKDNISKFLPDFFIELLKQVSPDSLLKAFPRENLLIDWSDTRAYFPSESSQGIRINLKGREPFGIVNPGFEYERLRDDIIRELYRLRDPLTFNNVIDVVYRREELYHGDCLNLAPDIFFVPRNYDYALKSSKRTSRSFIGNAKDLYPVDSIHSPDGLFMIYGPDIKQGATINHIDRYDIAPTVLDFLGLPLPKDFDGKVLRQVLAEQDYFSAIESSFEPTSNLHHIDKDMIFQRTNTAMSTLIR